MMVLIISIITEICYHQMQLVKNLIPHLNTQVSTQLTISFNLNLSYHL